MPHLFGRRAIGKKNNTEYRERQKANFKEYFKYASKVKSTAKAEGRRILRECGVIPCENTQKTGKR